MKKLMLGLMMAFAVTAEADIVKNYDLGNGLTATLDDQGVLTINGNGAMPNWNAGVNQVWYNERSQIKSVVAEGEITVGTYAFYWCDKLTSVSLPNVTTIGSNAFRNCKSLTSVTLPNVVTIEGYAFQNCPLNTISLPKATTIGTYAFYNCSSIASVSLPNATTIGNWAFAGCGLTSVSLPNVTTIGEFAFGSCSSLTTVSLPNATAIGKYAFSDCGSLTSVSLPNATTIESSVFAGCSELKTIYLNATMAVRIRRDRGFYGVGDDCRIFPETVVVEPHPAEYTTAKVYANGVEVTINPIEVVSNATVDVVFMAAEGYCFKDYTTVQTNTFTATDDPTEVDGPEAIRNLVVIEPYPAEHSTAKVYTDGAEVTSNPIEVLSNATVEVVFTTEEGYCFEDDHSTVQTNTVTATDDPTKVDGPMVVKIPSLKEDEVGKAEWEAETTITVSTALKSGDKTLDKAKYEYACEFYGVEVKAEPTEADFKVVPKDARVVPPPPEPPPGAVTSWDALTNAVATAASGAEIAVGADITEAGGELVVPAGKAVTIKLYGKTVSCGQVTVGGALTVGDAEDSVGRIVASNGAKVAKGGSVTLLGGPMRGTFTTLSPGVMLLFR